MNMNFDSEMDPKEYALSRFRGMTTPRVMAIMERLAQEAGLPNIAMLMYVIAHKLLNGESPIINNGDELLSDIDDLVNDFLSDPANVPQMPAIDEDILDDLISAQLPPDITNHGTIDSENEMGKFLSFINGDEEVIKDHTPEEEFEDEDADVEPLSKDILNLLHDLKNDSQGNGLSRFEEEEEEDEDDDEDFEITIEII